MTAKSHHTPKKLMFCLQPFPGSIYLCVYIVFLIVMPVQKKPAMKKPPAVMKTPAMKKPAGKPTPKATTDSDVARSGSNSPLPPTPDELQQLQAGLDRSAQNPEILEAALYKKLLPHLLPNLLLSLLLALILILLGLDRVLILIPLKLWSYLEGMICPKGQMLAKSFGEILEKAR